MAFFPHVVKKKKKDIDEPSELTLLDVISWLEKHSPL